jgi:hypothetical protein
MVVPDSPVELLAARLPPGRQPLSAVAGYKSLPVPDLIFELATNAGPPISHQKQPSRPQDK